MLGMLNSSFFDKEVKNVSDGALQDVHWSLGALGTSQHILWQP